MNDTKLIELNNGLKVIICKYNKPINIVNLYTNIGGLTDKLVDSFNIIPGTAHLLEHYVCENSKKGIIVPKLLDNNAIFSNASTSNNLILFYFKTKNNLNNLIKILLDGVYNVSFSMDKLNKTKIPIYSEIRDFDDDYEFDKDDKISRTLFKRNENILGNKDDINRIDCKYLKYVYENSFIPNNQLLIIITNHNIEKIINQLKQYYDNYKFKNTLKPIITDDLKLYKKELKLHENKIDETYISFKFCTNNYSSIQKYKLDFYLHIFMYVNFKAYSPLVCKLKEKNIIIEDLVSRLYTRNNCTVLEISSYTIDSKLFIKEIINFVNSIDFNEYNFNLEKEYIKTIISIRDDDIESYINGIIGNYYSHGYFHIDSLKDIENLNFNEYKDFITNLNFNNYSVVYLIK